MSYIVFEGADGTGKTTLAKTLAKTLEDAGNTVLLTHEPYKDHPICAQIRKWILDENKNLNKDARELLLCASRAISINSVLRPALKNYDFVISDRSFISGLVYGQIETLNFQTMLKLCQLPVPKGTSL